MEDELVLSEDGLDIKYKLYNLVIKEVLDVFKEFFLDMSGEKFL